MSHPHEGINASFFSCPKLITSISLRPQRLFEQIKMEKFIKKKKLNSVTRIKILGKVMTWS